MKLLETIRVFMEMNQNKKKADALLKEHIARTSPSLIQAYNAWALADRNVNCSAGTLMLGERYCTLEGTKPSANQRDICIFAGAAARISDDLTDNLQVNPREVYLLDSQPRETGNPEQALFYAFNQKLESILEADFKEKFRGLIKDYNKAQFKALKLRLNPTKEEVVRIKDNTGGVPFLLLYKLIFPENAIPADFNPQYNTRNRPMPKSKEEAIYNLGAWVSRVDDLYDQEIDRKEGLRSLATEGATSLETIGSELRYTRESLALFFPKRNVDQVMNEFDSQISRFGIFLNNFLAHHKKDK